MGTSTDRYHRKKNVTEAQRKRNADAIKKLNEKSKKK